VITFQLFYFTCWATAKINAIPSSRNGIWFTVLFQVFCDQLLSSAVKWSPCPRRGLTSPTCVLSVAALTTGNSPCRVTSDCASESTSNNIYTVSQKNKTPYLSRSLREILIDFLNSFTARLGTKSAYKIIITYPGIPSYRREIAVFWLRVYITRSLVPALCSLLNDIKNSYSNLCIYSPLTAASSPHLRLQVCVYRVPQFSLVLFVTAHLSASCEWNGKKSALRTKEMQRGKSRNTGSQFSTRVPHNNDAFRDQFYFKLVAI